MGRATRSAAQALGLELLADPSHASPAVTTIKSPSGVEVKALRKQLREKYGVDVAGGQGKLADKIFRIGHLGYITPPDLMVTFAALEKALIELGVSIQSGSGVTALIDVLDEKAAVAG
jgi:aspartate aminotransferase-like enzyme